MKQFNLVKHFRKVMGTVILLVAIGILNSCNNSSTNSEAKDSTVSTMSDTSTITTDTMPKSFDSLQNRTDTGRGDQTAPPPK